MISAAIGSRKAIKERAAGVPAHRRGIRKRRSHIKPRGFATHELHPSAGMPLAFVAASPKIGPPNCKMKRATSAPISN